MTKPYRVIYAPQAVDDLRDIYFYIAKSLQAPDTARNQVSRIRMEIRSLDFMPMRYSVVDWTPWKGRNMRHFPVDHFVVFYLVDPDAMTVSIIRIVYGGRDLRHIIDSE